VRIGEKGRKVGERKGGVEETGLGGGMGEETVGEREESRSVR